MAAAETGDDVYGEDPTVSQLEKLAASMTGKDAALFVTSGTQGNLLALLSHCERGDEYIAGNSAHTYRFEAGGGERPCEEVIVSSQCRSYCEQSLYAVDVSIHCKYAF